MDFALGCRVSQAGHFDMVASLLHMHVGHSHLLEALELNIADREFALLTAGRFSEIHDAKGLAKLSYKPV